MDPASAAGNTLFNSFDISIHFYQSHKKNCVTQNMVNITMVFVTFCAIFVKYFVYISAALCNLFPDFFFNSENAGTVTGHSSTTDTETHGCGPEGSESMVILDSEDENEGVKGDFSISCMSC